MTNSGVEQARVDVFTYQPGGRWERILSEMLRQNRPLSRVEMRDVAKSTKATHDCRVERKKLDRALRAMTRAGLLVASSGPDGTVWQPTAAGERAIFLEMAA